MVGDAGAGVSEAETASGAGGVYPEGLLLSAMSQLCSSEVLKM